MPRRIVGLVSIVAIAVSGLAASGTAHAAGLDAEQFRAVAEKALRSFPDGPLPAGSVVPHGWRPANVTAQAAGDLGGFVGAWSTGYTSGADAEITIDVVQSATPALAKAIVASPELSGAVTPVVGLTGGPFSGFTTEDVAGQSVTFVEQGFAVGLPSAQKLSTRVSGALVDGRNVVILSSKNPDAAAARSVVQAWFAKYATLKSAAPKRTSAKPKPATDQDLAASALLKPSELPLLDPETGFAGWDGIDGGGLFSPAGRDVLDFGNPDDAFPACAATLAAEHTSESSRVDGLEWGTNADSLGNSIYVFPTVKRAKAYLATYMKPAAQQCFQHSFDTREAGAPNPGSFAPFDMSTVTSPSLDEGVGFTWTIPAFRTNPDAEVFQDVWVRSGRAVIFLSKVDSGEIALGGFFAAIADRLKAELAK